MSDCLFCQIVAGEIPSKPVAQSERAYAFYDIAPQAPVHVLVVSKEHITSADEIVSTHGGIVDDMILLAQEVVDDRAHPRERLPPGLQHRQRRPDDRSSSAHARPRRTSNGVATGMTFDATAQEALTATTFVPNTHLMSGLLGPRDEHLRIIEHSFPKSKIRVQGNQIAVTGPDAAKVLRLFDELVLVLESGQALDIGQDRAHHRHGRGRPTTE